MNSYGTELRDTMLRMEDLATAKQVYLKWFSDSYATHFAFCPDSPKLQA